MFSPLWMKTTSRQLIVKLYSASALQSGREVSVRNFSPHIVLAVASLFLYFLFIEYNAILQNFYISRNYLILYTFSVKGPKLFSMILNYTHLIWSSTKSYCLLVSQFCMMNMFIFSFYKGKLEIVIF